MRTSRLRSVRPGEIREGIVTSVVHFGAFVNLGECEGLVHNDELSWNVENSPDALVSVGSKLLVQVLEVDLDGERVLLSHKATQAAPSVERDQ